jgi:protein phosphatase
MSSTAQTETDLATGRKPRDDEIDVYGVTDTGRTRKNNQDHFLICSLHRQVKILGTSLPPDSAWPSHDRMAFFAMVADGVGGSSQGEEASRVAVERIMDYVTRSMKCYYTADASDDATFSGALEEAAMQAHEHIAELAREDPDRRGMATTLTVFMGVWPRAYILQVGDSRCYVLRKGELIQISRDQTMAQELVDQGVLSRTEAPRTRWAHVLSSSIGGGQTAPVVTRFDSAWGNVVLLCSDGLTKHVSDERIRERLHTMTSARQVCEALLKDALDDGGTDNITIIVGRALMKNRE